MGTGHEPRATLATLTISQGPELNRSESARHGAAESKAGVCQWNRVLWGTLDPPLLGANGVRAASGFWSKHWVPGFLFQVT